MSTTKLKATHMPNDNEFMSPFYVDIPSIEAVTNEDGPFIAVESFTTEQEALDFAADKFGADSLGRVSLISGADHSKQLTLEAAAPDMLETLEHAAEIIKVARRYFPKSVSNHDRFNLENTNAAINKAIAKARGEVA